MKNIVYITATLPALTVTFIYNEIFRLRERGARVRTVSMNTPPDDRISASARELRHTTLYLDQVSFLRKLAAFGLVAVLFPLRTGRCLRHLFTASPVKLPRDFFRLGYHLIEAAYLARQFRADPPEHLHSHFVNGPTSIAMFLGILLAVPYSFTMHASMIWLDPVAFRNKLETSAFCVSISDYNRRYVLETYGEKYATKFHIVHCGINPESEPTQSAAMQGDGPLRILGVGQLNRRKGFHVLVDALAILKNRDRSFDCTIVGDGAERIGLEKAIKNNKLEDNVTLAGALLHEQVQGLLGAADVFVLPCVVSEDGWRDGIPVALMEAMYAGLPVISTNILGLPELIDDGVNGLLVPSDDPEALAGAIARLGTDPDLRRRLGEAGRAKVLRDFNNDTSAAQLHDLFEAQSA